MKSIKRFNGYKHLDEVVFYLSYVSSSLVYFAYMPFVNTLSLKRINFKEYMSDSFTNYNYVGNTKVSVSIKKTYANKCT